MKTRRELLIAAAAANVAGIAAINAASATPGGSNAAPKSQPLRAPKGRKIRVAFAVGVGANVMDTIGPWEVFQDVFLDADGAWGDENAEPAFDLFTVGETADTVSMTGGLLVQPNYTVENAPQPDLIVIPAQMGAIPKSIDWIKEVAPQSTVTMSICTGAFPLARTGLLEGLSVTTHHDYYDAFEKKFPDLDLIRGKRFVDNGRIASAGGLTSGIDMALHIVERYFGRPVATATADYMEYKSALWTE